VQISGLLSQTATWLSGLGFLTIIYDTGRSPKGAAQLLKAAEERTGTSIGAI
jgi:hypothetical protein